MRYVSTYFTTFPGYFFTGDGARRDEDGYLWITGRVDDLMNVSGHLLSTVEIESVLASDNDVVEAAVVSASHDIKGSHPYAFVSLKNGVHLTERKIQSLKQRVRQTIGAIAIPDVIQEAPKLPKTRSGKSSNSLPSSILVIHVPELTRMKGMRVDWEMWKCDLLGELWKELHGSVRGVHLTERKIQSLKQRVRQTIGAIAIPDVIQEAPKLPKTRSGKVTRRILRKIAEGDKSADMGDTTTLDDESVISSLWEGRDQAMRKR
ncbi:Acetyl-coenzyme A synthetase [Toxocara canis]|uniref:Acetyl-coenzyme A synthetase n=1 Tax=Toxocara canis TaxID=6265 RepID=A0A0B2ULI6_TOXCA|nr:Acetyl-coenzyme A synthetase [Toxocara canis]